MRQGESNMEQQKSEGTDAWTQFFRAVRRLAQQLDEQEADAEKELSRE